MSDEQHQTLGTKLAWACYSILLAIVMGLGGGAASKILDHHARIAALEEGQHGMLRALQSIEHKMERIAQNLERRP